MKASQTICQIELITARPPAMVFLVPCQTVDRDDRTRDFRVDIDLPGEKKKEGRKEKNLWESSSSIDCLHTHQLYGVMSDWL